MNTTVSDLIMELSKLERHYGDKPITIICPNGLRVFPNIRFKREDISSPIEEIVLSWE